MNRVCFAFADSDGQGKRSAGQCCRPVRESPQRQAETGIHFPGLGGHSRPTVAITHFTYTGAQPEIDSNDEAVNYGSIYSGHSQSQREECSSPN